MALKREDGRQMRLGDSRVKPGLRARAVTFPEAVQRFGTSVKAKLSNPSARGNPEDQIRAPFERLITDLATVLVANAQLTAVGELPLKESKTRPDYAITLSNALVGFVELKAPGKGADPRRFKGRDKEQWEKLRSLPNLIYTDGSSFALWRNGEPAGEAVSLIGDIEISGADLRAPDSLLRLFSEFLQWQPLAPRDAQQLAETTARLCRLLRDEVSEQLAGGSRTITMVARDWRKYFFPNASDEQVADGYAQAITFGMLMARARGISLANGLDRTGQELGHTVIGTALRALTFSGPDEPLTIRTLIRVLDAVDWNRIGRGNPEAWLYFYEQFLATYDNKLRKQTGSYYTPAEVVSEMVRLVDELLRSRFSLSDGLASNAVTLVDPAVGTGTFILGVLQKIASTVGADQGPGAVPAAIDAAARRLIAFESQLGPFAVAQLRVLAELKALVGEAPSLPPRMFVTDTLANPYVEQEWLPQMLAPIAESRKEANQIKSQERIMVVLGNPPYREKAKGHGGWIEEGDDSPDGTKKTRPPLDAWIPPPDWGVGAHTKHLRNLYVYFWRWATWKVFDQQRADNNGIVCFISVAGFLNGPGFQRMRDYLRRTTDEIWVIDCSPEGQQSDVNTRIFEGVQQPVCIVIASRSPHTDTAVPATVRFRALPSGERRSTKFPALAKISLVDGGWVNCASGWRDPFLPASAGAWSTFLPLDELFVYNGSGVMPGRTWVIAPDADSLTRRWQALIDASAEEKETLFHPHLRGGEPGDKHSKKVVPNGLTGHESRPCSAADDRGPCITPVRYAFRSFDRQWIIPDNRLINQANPELWETHSNSQVYMTALNRTSPKIGPAVTFTSLMPDQDHYNGKTGRVFPLWLDKNCSTPNVRPGLLTELKRRYRMDVQPADVLAYVAALTAHPAYTARFQSELLTPGLRIPLTAEGSLFAEAVELGRALIWLHTFGERYTSATDGRSARSPRLPKGAAPIIPTGGAIGTEMPDDLRYDAVERRMYLGTGYIDGVPQEVWAYEVSGKQVIHHWFSYRKANRDRPIIGERRTPSVLGAIQPNRWPAEYTTELLNLINVLALLVELEPKQANLLDRVCQRQTLGAAELRLAGALDLPVGYPSKPTDISKSVSTPGAQSVLPFGKASARS